MRRTSLTLLAMLCFAVLIAATPAFAAPFDSDLILADQRTEQTVNQQLKRSIAADNLKKISTKTSPPEALPALAQQHDDDSVAPLELTPVLPPKIMVEPAPGTREPAEDKTADKSTDTSPAAKPVHAHKEAPGVPAEKALTWLLNGNKRYVTRATRADGKSQKDRDRLTKGQHPHAIVLSCSDSRVPPETVFDQTLGEVFVVRTAGEGLDSSVIASLEYAVEHLGPRLLVVMGHTSCGAVQAAIDTAEGQSAGSESLDKLLADIRPRLPARSEPAQASKNLEIESSTNAQGVAADLLKRSPAIRARVEKGDLVIKPALYFIDSGVVKFY